jgi:hypothetical protein
MAEHFLDTETRQEIPATALRCTEAGLSIEAARRVWRCEVSPAVGLNVWLVAGEWAGWDSACLVAKIERLRARPAALRWLRDRFALEPLRGVRGSIERCLDLLNSLPAHDAQARMCEDLRFLAQHYFDFCPRDPNTLKASDLERIVALYPRPFQHVFGPAVQRGEQPAAERRLHALLVPR